MLKRVYGAREIVDEPIVLPVAPASPLTPRVEPEFDFASAEYRHLHVRARATAFQAPSWLVGIGRSIAPKKDAEPFTVTVRDRNERLLLVLPLVRTQHKVIRRIEFADLGVSDYNVAVYDPLNAPTLLADPTLRVRIGQLLGRCDVVSLEKLPDDDPVLAALFPLGRRAPMRLSAYPTRLSGTWMEWRACHLSKRLRSDLDRKRRSLARIDRLSFDVVRSAQEVRRAFDALRRFRAARFERIGAADLLQDPAYFEFYVGQAIAGLTTGNARTYSLSVGDAPVAVMFGLEHERTFSLLLLGFDQETYPRPSLGLLIVEDGIRHSMAEGLTTFDFTIGDHPYKTEFGADVAPLFEAHWPRSPRGWLSVLMGEVEREAKRKLKPYFK